VSGTGTKKRERHRERKRQHGGRVRKKRGGMVGKFGISAALRGWRD